MLYASLAPTITYTPLEFVQFARMAPKTTMNGHETAEQGVEWKNAMTNVRHVRFFFLHRKYEGVILQREIPRSPTQTENTSSPPFFRRPFSVPGIYPFSV